MHQESAAANDTDERKIDNEIAEKRQKIQYERDILERSIKDERSMRLELDGYIAKMKEEKNNKEARLNRLACDLRQATQENQEWQKKLSLAKQDITNLHQASQKQIKDLQDQDREQQFQMQELQNVYEYEIQSLVNDQESFLSKSLHKHKETYDELQSHRDSERALVEKLNMTIDQLQTEIINQKIDHRQHYCRIANQVQNTVIEGQSSRQADLEKRLYQCTSETQATEAKNKSLIEEMRHKDTQLKDAINRLIWEKLKLKENIHSTHVECSKLASQFQLDEMNLKAKQNKIKQLETEVKESEKFLCNCKEKARQQQDHQHNIHNQERRKANERLEQIHARILSLEQEVRQQQAMSQRIKAKYEALCNKLQTNLTEVVLDVCNGRVN